MTLLRTQIIRKVQNTAGDAINGATATIVSLPSSATATVYSTETGTATISQPLISGLDGGFSGWLEEGHYSVTIASSSGTSTSRYYANHPYQSNLFTDAASVPLTVSGTTAQSANLTEWNNVGGTVIASIDGSGSISSPTITAIQGSVTNTQGSVVTLSGTVGTAVTNISNISGSVSSINSSLGSALGTISTNTAAIGSVSGTVTNIVTQPFGTVNADYTIGTSDSGKLIKLTQANGTTTVTIPTNGSVAFPIGQKIDFVQTVAGTTIFAAGSSSITLRGNPFTNITKTNSKVFMIKIDTNDWFLSGDLAERNWISYPSAGARYWNGIAASNNGQYITAADGNSTVLIRSSNYGTAWSTASAGSSTTYWNAGVNAVAMGTTGQYQTAIDAQYGGNIWVSSNYGTAWTVKGTAFSPKQYQCVTMSGNGQYQFVTAFNDYVIKSTDFGATWGTATNSGSRAWRGISCSASGQYVTALDQGGYIYTSSDYGVNWTARTGPGLQNWYGVTVAPIDGTTQYATNNGGYLFISTDRGITWNAVTQLGQLDYAYFITCSYSGAKVALNIPENNSKGYVWTSSDYGTTWTKRIASGSSLRYVLTYTQDFPSSPKLFVADYLGYIQQAQDSL